MKPDDDGTTELENQLARELDTHLDISGAAPGDIDAPAGLAAPLEALNKLREALRPSVNSTIPEIPGFSYRGELGRGGMGVVLRAYDAALEREVAIKFLAPEFAADPKARERFLREARSLAKVRHPNLVAVHTAGEVDGRPYFAMELVEGTSLDRAIVKSKKGDGGVLPAGARERSKVVARLFAETADALATIHRAGLLHRDVKPANILISTDGSARLADFGISADRRRGEEVSDNGTLRYLSPERVSGVHGEEDPRSDLYALGLSLLESLTLTPIFTQKNSAELRAAILAGIVVPTGERVRGVDPELLAIASRAAARNAADRFGDAGEIARALRDALDTKKIYTKPIFIAIGAVALVASGVGIAAVAGAFRNDPPRGFPKPPIDNINNRDPRDPKDNLRGPGPGPRRGGNSEFNKMQDDIRYIMPAVGRLRDLSASHEWDKFRHEAERILENSNDLPPSKIAQAWILVLQENPEPEKARAMVNDLPQGLDPGPQNPIEKMRRELLDFLDGKSPSGHRPPPPSRR